MYYQSVQSTKKVLSISISILLGITFSLAALINFRSDDVYRYDVARDYKYDFSYGPARRVALQIKNETFVLPDAIKSGDVVFLDTKVQSSFLGKFIFHPYVSISRANNELDQYFEKGALGSRYINISNLVSDTDSANRFSLRGHFMSIPDQVADVIIYKPHPSRNSSKILVIAPHPDDAEIAAFGTYKHRNSYIVTVTAGDAGANNYRALFSSQRAQYLQKGKLRVWNSVCVPMLAGIPPTRSINLGYFDTTLAHMYSDKYLNVTSPLSAISDTRLYRNYNLSPLLPSSDGNANWNNLASDLATIISTIKPDIIIAPYPAIDSNMDHKLSTVAVIEALKKLRMHDGSLFLYTNHLPLSDYYPYGAPKSVLSLPPTAAPVLFNSILSVPLSVEEQDEKILVLDAMNDLRLNTEWQEIRGAIKVLRRSIRNLVADKDASYYRRAIRSNELFFVIPIDDIYDELKLKQILGKFP